MNRKNQGRPLSGYCLNVIRKRLSSLWLAALLLFLGAAAVVYGWMQIGADKTTWDFMEYIKLGIGWVGALFFLASGAGTAYTALRDALCPEKSTLARSIRRQMPYPDAAPAVQELFAMVDRDIGENGQWFDKVAVGKEWILGDVASYIPRIRVFFGRDEIRSHRSGERVNTTRIVELYILDDRRQVQVTTLRNPKELPPLLDCISLRAPDALRRPYSEYAGWRQKPDMEWENVLREYRVKQGERELDAFRMGSADAAMKQNMILTLPDGSVTSRVTPDLIRQTLLECLKQGEGTFSLSPGCPMERNGSRFVELECFAAFYEDVAEASVQEMEELGEARLLLKIVSGKTQGELYSGRVCRTDIRTAERILQEWFRGELPHMENWEIVPPFTECEQEKKRK